MTELHATYKDGILTLQRRKYIEDGWYIESVAGVWKLFYIPQYGGEPQFIGSYTSFKAAYEKALTLL